MTRLNEGELADIRMADWEAALDTLLRDIERPILTTVGSVSHDAALTWPEQQYDAFAERRCLETEATSDARYLEDLERTAKLLERNASKTDPRTKATRGGRRKGRSGP